MKLKELKYVEAIGQGSFCLVEKYQDPQTGAFYALKKLKSEHWNNFDYIERFIKEIQYLDDLKGCDNIIELTDSEATGLPHEIYLLMPFVSNNLQSFILKRNANLNFDERCEIFEQIIAAIDFAHGLDILHRDLAPSNILVEDYNGKINVKVSDFGLGKDLYASKDLTNSSINWLGHLDYTAPEQLDKLKNASKQSDIFSLGRVCYFVFTGYHPRNFVRFEFNTLMDHATANNPKDRHSNTTEFKDEYFQLKQLYQSIKNANTTDTLKQFLSRKNSIDNAELHERLIRDWSYADISEDYLLPVSEFFLEGRNLDNYFRYINGGFVVFIESFFKQYQSLPTVGWDFRFLDTYSEFLSKVIETVKSPTVRLICFKLLFKMSFGYDSFHAQNKLKTYLVSKYIRDEIIGDIAEFLTVENFRIEFKFFNKNQMPPALFSLIEELINKRLKEEESRRIMSNVDDFI